MSATDDGSQFDWTLRASVYRHFAEHGRAPSAGEAAVALGVDHGAILAGLARLHARHALFLDPGDGTIRIANPFSNVPTSFRVRAGGRAYWANCAWDALGIPAALQADAEIDAGYGDDGEPVSLAVAGGAVHGPDGAVVHFPLPVRRWYDDPIRT